MNWEAKWISLAVAAAAALFALRASAVCGTCLRLPMMTSHFLTGTALLAGLVGGLAWLESAPWRQIGEHFLIAATVLSAVWMIL